MRRFITPVLLDSSVSKTDFTAIPVSRSKSFRIGSEKTWSSLTYTTTVCELVGRHDARIGISARVTRTPIELRIIFRRRGTLLFAAKTEVVERLCVTQLAFS